MSQISVLIDHLGRAAAHRAAGMATIPRVLRSCKRGQGGLPEAKKVHRQRAVAIAFAFAFAFAVAFAVAVAVAFQLPVERAVSPGLEADKVRRLSERSAA
jgi:hypothetical protein